MKRLFVILGILVVLVVAGGYLVANGYVPFIGGGRGDDATKAKSVRVERIGRGDLVEIVAAPGTIVPETNVQISARVSAKIAELPFKVGQRVTKGDAANGVPASVLVRLDSTEIDASLRAAQARADGQKAAIATAAARIDARLAQLRSQRVLLENRQTELERQESLLTSNDVSKQTVDDLRASVSQLVAQIESEEVSIEADRADVRAMDYETVASQAEVDRIRDNLNYTTITSPIDGVVTKVNVEAGEIAVTGTMNNAGTVLLEVADLSTMVVEARVDETDIANVKEQQKAIVRMEAYPNQTFDGTVQTVALARSTDETDRAQYYEVKVLVDRKGKTIVSGLTADVEIQTQRHANVLKVPSQSVMGRPADSLPDEAKIKPEVDANRNSAIVVFRYVDGKSTVTPVRVGASDLTHTVIESGLNDGDAVIIGPYKVLESIQHGESLTEEANPATRPTTAPATASTGAPATAAN